MKRLMMLMLPLIIVSCTSLQHEPLPHEAYWASKSSDQTSALRKKLSRRIDVNFKDDALQDALESIRSKSSINLHVDWKSLEAAGIDKNVPCTVQVVDTSVELCLHLVLISTGGGATSQLCYYIDQNVVCITTVEAAGYSEVACVYDIRELVRSNFLAGVSTTQPTSFEEARGAQIMEMIAQTLTYQCIYDGSWISNHGGLLVVKLSQKDQEKVSRLLDDLKKQAGIK